MLTTLEPHVYIVTNVQNNIILKPFGCFFLSWLVPLSDPTCYAPVIDYVRTLAESMDDGKNYVVLLIITDGGISGEFNILKNF